VHVEVIGGVTSLAEVITRPCDSRVWTSDDQFDKRLTLSRASSSA